MVTCWDLKEEEDEGDDGSYKNWVTFHPLSFSSSSSSSFIIFTWHLSQYLSNALITDTKNWFGKYNFSSVFEWFSRLDHWQKWEIHAICLMIISIWCFYCKTNSIIGTLRYLNWRQLSADDCKQLVNFWFLCETFRAFNNSIALVNYD